MNKKTFNKHLKALRTTFFVALFCAIPLGFLYHLTLDHVDDDFFTNVEARPFIWKIDHVTKHNPKYNKYLETQKQGFIKIDKNNGQKALENDENRNQKTTQTPVYFTNQSLLGFVTIIFHISDECSTVSANFSQKSQDTQSQKDQLQTQNYCNTILQRLITFSKKLDYSFSLREHFDETQLSLSRIIVTKNPQKHDLISQFSQDDDDYYASNLVIIKKDKTVNDDLSTIYNKKKVMNYSHKVKNPNNTHINKTSQELNLGSFVMIIDKNAKIKAMISNDYLMDDIYKKSVLMAIVSRVYFYSSMNEYLSKRTFFGEKKKY